MDEIDVAPKRILLVDDHPLVRVGVAQVIDETGRYEVCGEASNTDQALQQVNEKQPDLVLVDLSLEDSNGLDLIRELSRRVPPIPSLVLSMHDEPVYIEHAFRAGARGYLLKRESVRKVATAIDTVFQGKTYVSESVSASLAESLRSHFEDDNVDPLEVLSHREYEIFQLLGQGFSRKETAERLSVSLKTIESHINRIRQKLLLDSGRKVIHSAIRHFSTHSPDSSQV